MASVNRVTLIGHLGRDPEIRSTQSGDKIANLSLATSETWNDKASGERKERTEWHRVSILNDHLAETVEKYAKKGSMLYVSGSLQTRKWTDKDGQDRYTTEVMIGRFNSELKILDAQSGGRSEESRPARSAERPRDRRAPPQKPVDWDAPRGGDLDDEIPF